MTLAHFNEESAKLDTTGKRKLAHLSLKWTALTELLIIATEFNQICKVINEIEENEPFVVDSKDKMDEIRNEMKIIRSMIEKLHDTALGAIEEKLNSDLSKVVISGIKIRTNPLKEKIRHMRYLIGEFTIFYLATNMCLIDFIRQDQGANRKWH